MSGETFRAATRHNTSCSNNTWGDRKVRIKILPFLYLSLFRDEILSNNAAIYMQLIHCNNACIKRARALQLSFWKHRLTVCGAT